MSFLQSMPDRTSLLEVFKAYPQTAKPLIVFHQVLMRGDSSLTVDADVDDEVAAGHPGDESVLFVDGVVLDDAAGRPRMFQEFWAVPRFDRLQPGDTRTDDLSPATKTRHQVRLDQAGGNLQIRVDVTLIDVDGYIVSGRAKMRVRFAVLAKVIFDPIVVGDVRADHLDEFFAFIGTQAGAPT